MSAWVLARQEPSGEMLYWRGRDLHPRWSPFISDAHHFSSARCAYEAAATHPELNPDTVKAVPRDRRKRRAV